MPDYFVQNDNTGVNSGVVDSHKPGKNRSAEKLQKALEAGTNTLDLNVGNIVMGYSLNGSGMHMNMFELVMGFMHYWSSLYETGGVTKGERMYTMCQMAHNMVAHAHTPVPVEPEGRHRSE